MLSTEAVVLGLLVDQMLKCRMGLSSCVTHRCFPVGETNP